MWSSTLLMSSLLFYSYGGGPAVLIRSYFVKLTCGKSRVVCKSWPEPRDDAIEVCEHQQAACIQCIACQRWQTVDKLAVNDSKVNY